MSVPRVTPFTENTTLATVPSASAAVAATVCVTPTFTVDAVTGLSMLIVGEVPALTTTLMPAEVVCEPRLSVATAVRV